MNKIVMNKVIADFPSVKLLHKSSDITHLYPYYVLGVLWLVALFRLVDLQIIAVLLESIKQEFSFSDTQLGLLSGLAFALFYATFGIPIAYLADRYSRKNILSVCLGVWSVMTALCACVSGYKSFFLARLGVGIGEAGGYPPTTSLLSDYFPAEKRGLVFAILGSAIPVGIFVAFVCGGYINEHYGWRVAYLAVGIPGVLLALLIRFTVHEPVRGSADGNVDTISSETFMETLKILWQKKDYCWVLVGAAFSMLAATGSGIWIASFFIRVHGMGSAEVGGWMGGMYGLGGLIGTLLGGFLADKLSKKYNDSSYYMKVCGVSLAAVLPLAVFVFTTTQTSYALFGQFLIIILMHMNVGPILAMVQNLAGASRRSMSQAVNVLLSNLIGLALGPLIVGLLSDMLTPLFGDVGLGYSILSIYILGYVIAASSFFVAARKTIKN